MINVVTVPSGTATLLSAAKVRNWFTIHHEGSGVLHVALDGSDDVTVAGGAKPGIPVSQSGHLIQAGSNRAPSSFDADIYGIHDLGSDLRVVIQEG